MKKFLLVFLATLWSFQAQAADLTKVKVGAQTQLYSSLQLAVMVNQGWVEEAGLELDIRNFNFPVSMLQAHASGDLDIIYNSPAIFMSGVSEGLDIQVYAANTIKMVDVIAVGKLAELLKEHGSVEAIKLFYQETGKPVQLASLSKGSFMDALLRNWIQKNNLSQETNVIQTGLDQIQQSVLTGSVDAGWSYEPQLTVLREGNVNFSYLAKAEELLPSLPVIAAATSNTYMQKHPEIVTKMAALQVRASNFIRQNPAQAAKDFNAVTGKGLLDEKTLEKAIRNVANYFVSDPTIIIEATKAKHDIMFAVGSFDQRVDVESMFNTHFYDEALKANDGT